MFFSSSNIRTPHFDARRDFGPLVPAAAASAVWSSLVVGGRLNRVGVNHDVSEAFPPFPPSSEALRVKLEGLEPEAGVLGIVALKKKYIYLSGNFFLLRKKVPLHVYESVYGSQYDSMNNLPTSHIGIIRHP
jgi:hypothetical protein